MEKVNAIREALKGIEWVRCNLCGANEFEVIHHIRVRDDQVGDYGRDYWDIVRCRNCDLIYTNPRPDSEALQEYYKYENEYDFNFIQDWFIENADLQRSTWRRFLRAKSRYGEPGRLLDIGCGAGTFLVEARDQGYDVFGQEISHFFVDFGQSQYGLKVFEGEIEKLPPEMNLLDYITAFDVIEHHPDPAKLIREIHRRLRPGGIVVISTHDIGNPLAKFYRANWRYINPIGHLTYFTRQTLSQLLTQNGFRILHIEGIHTIDDSRPAEIRNWVVQFLRVIVLRSMIITIYKPITNRYQNLTHWQIKWRNAILNHKKLLNRAGDQVIMNDDMVVIAKSES